MKPTIVSFPRSGRTWLCSLIGLNICHYKGLDIRLAQLERAKLVAATHDRTDKSLKVHADDLKTDKSEFKDERVLFLKREPKDTLVSAHLHATNRKGNFNGTLSEYVRDPRFGIEKILRFEEIWEDNANVPTEFMVITYEDLVDRTFQLLMAVCRFFGIPFTEESVSRAVEDGHIDKLRKAEADGFFEGGIGRPKRPKNLDSYYHRKGGVGGYVDYMPPEDIAYCEEKINEL